MEKALIPETQLNQSVPPIPPDTDTAVENQTEVPNAEAIELINRFAPGSDTSSPEAIMAGLMTVLKSMVPIYDKLYDVAEASPEAAAFISDLIDTGDPVSALVRNYDEEEIKAVLEELNGGDYEEAKGVFAEKSNAIKTEKARIQKNMDISLNDVSEFMEERKDWPTEKSEAFETYVIKFFEDGKDGLISKEALINLEKSFNYDGDVAEAGVNGQIVGRNENIVAKKATEKDLAALLPDAVSGMSAPPKKAEKPKSFAGEFMKGVKL